MHRGLIAALAGAVLAGAGYVWFSPNKVTAQTAPSGGTGEPMVSVILPELDGDAQIGARAFDTFCATCHGPAGAGRNGSGPPLIHPIYEPGHHGDMAFFMAAQNGVQAHHWRFGNMPPVAGISQAEVGSIVAYIRAVQRANGIE